MLEPQPIPVSERDPPPLPRLGAFLPFFWAGALEEVLLWPLISKVCAMATDPTNSKQPRKLKVRLADIRDPCGKFQTLRLATRSDAHMVAAVGHESRTSSEKLTGKVEPL